MVESANLELSISYTTLTFPYEKTKEKVLIHQ